MKKDISVLVLGGDRRQRILSALLSADGYKVTYINNNAENIKDAIKSNDIIFLPLPVSKDRVHIYSDNGDFRFKLKEVLSDLKNTSVVFGGGFSKEAKEYLEYENISYHDCQMSELFELQNAHFTAQGALKLLLDNTQEFLKDKNALVTGYGRISSALAVLLSSLRIKVTIAARNEIQLKTAEFMGYEAINLKELKGLSGYDYVFNTVPFVIFDEEAVASADKKCVYFELASAPFGASKEHFDKYGITYVVGTGLPGKMLPQSSARLLKEYMEQFI